MIPTIAIDTEAARRRALLAISGLPLARYVIEVKEPSRTRKQNDKLWPMLADVSRQCRLSGMVYSPDAWKCVFMQALGWEQRMAPALNGEGPVPLGYRSKLLTIKQFSDLIEYIYAYGAEQGIQWSEPSQKVIAETCAA